MGKTADEAQELRDWVKGIKPDCIISGRIGHQKGDYMTTGDNFIPRLPYDGDWEVPATVNDTWGYNKYDTNWKNRRLRRILPADRRTYGRRNCSGSLCRGYV